MGPLFSDYPNMSSFPAANTGPLGVQLWIHARFVQEGWREGHVAPQGASVVRGASTHLQLLFAARGPPKASSEPRRGRGTVFRNSRISLSAWRRACEPAAKPAISGVILLHYGFVCYERTQVTNARSVLFALLFSTGRSWPLTAGLVAVAACCGLRWVLRTQLSAGRAATTKQSAFLGGRFPVGAAFRMFVCVCFKGHATRNAAAEPAPVRQCHGHEGPGSLSQLKMRALKGLCKGMEERHRLLEDFARGLMR
jgi:hypothetical protein